MNKEKKIERLKSLRREGLEVCSMKLAREILTDYPNEFSVLIILGFALSALDRHDDAVDVISNAIQFATYDQEYEAYVTMAFVYFGKREFSMAESWYKKAFNQHSPRSIDQIFYAECLIKRGEYLDAIDVLSGIDSTKGNKFYTLGVAYRAIEKYDHALECFQKALSLDLGDVNANEAIIDILRAKSLDVC